MDDTKGVWLVRLPVFLHDYFNEQVVQGNRQLGDVGHIVMDPNKKGQEMKFELTLASQDEKLKGKPKSYKMKTRALDQQLKAFSEDSMGQVGMVGTVVMRADLVPEEGAVYADMLGSKLKRAEVKTASTKVADAPKRSLEEKKEMYKRARQEARDALTAIPEQRVEMSRDEMVAAVIALFEEEPYWTSRDVERRTGQSAKLVQEALKELATRVASGEHKNKYQLRDEFKVQQVTKKTKTK